MLPCSRCSLAAPPAFPRRARTPRQRRYSSECCEPPRRRSRSTTSRSNAAACTSSPRAQPVSTKRSTYRERPISLLQWRSRRQRSVPVLTPGSCTLCRRGPGMFASLSVHAHRMCRARLKYEKARTGVRPSVPTNVERLWRSPLVAIALSTSPWRSDAATIGMSPAAAAKDGHATLRGSTRLMDYRLA